MSIVHLQKEDQSLVLNLAHARNDPKEAIGLPSGFNGSFKRPSIISHIMGLKGEVAVAKLLGLKVDETISLHGDNDRGDLQCPDGRMISVKCREKPWYDFALTTDRLEEFKTDIGILCFLTNKEWDIDVYGWVYKDTFINNYARKDYGHGPRLVLEKKYFNKF